MLPNRQWVYIGSLAVLFCRKRFREGTAPAFLITWQKLGHISGPRTELPVQTLFPLPSICKTSPPARRPSPVRFAATHDRRIKAMSSTTVASVEGLQQNDYLTGTSIYICVPRFMTGCSCFDDCHRI